MTPEEFPSRFAAYFAAREADGLAMMLAADGTMLTITGLWCEGRREIASGLRAEMAGACARARLVTGRTQLRPLGTEAKILHQRFVLSGIVDEEGNESGRIATVLTAVLVARGRNWEALNLQFTAVEG
ncbi:MAG: DUF4440 domain-containing protein [Cereibacter changlensis]|jgi:uncharacterized protein (TIGR02246 family)|nr:DUF4440 domain-containing protein [Cereibacter changlensis]PZX53755.1 uncharacterized protein (TIGR02246 family) [Cereibacter changlensis]